MQAVLTVITQVGILTFVVAGMAAVGLKLTVRQIITPLRDPRLVVGLLVANFAVVPGVAVLTARVLSMDDATGTAIILIGCCAGAPFLPTLPKLAHGARHNIPITGARAAVRHRLGRGRDGAGTDRDRRMPCPMHPARLATSTSGHDRSP